MKTVKTRLSFNRRILSCYNALKICIKEKRLYQVSALTLDTLLAIVPAITVSIYMAAWMPLFGGVIDGLVAYAFNNYIPEAGKSIQQYVQQFVGHAVTLPVGGIMFLFATVIMLMVLVKLTMNDIWHSARKASLARVVVSWVALFLLPLLVGLSIFLSHYFLSLSWVDYTVNHLDMAFLLTSLLPVFINMIAFSMLYYLVPDCHVNFSDALFGALTAAALFEIAKRIFEFYLRNFATYDIIYGSLATIPTFMIWIYISWSIIIFGAVVTYAQNQQRII